MIAIMGLAKPPADAPIESSSDESETDQISDTESECERGPAGAESDKQSSKAEGGATTSSVMNTPSKVGTTVKEQPAEKVRGQCNLDDEPDLEVWDEPRIRESQLTAEQKAKYKAQLGRIFSQETLQGQRISFVPDEVLDVMFDVEPYLNSEPMLIEDVPFDVIVVGDLFGQLYDLYRIFNQFAKDGKPGWECRKFVFLGNYVDRGRQSLEIVMALFIIKMLHPDRIWLLRGSHEFMAVNSEKGFQMEIYRRYNFEDPCKYVYQQINMTFCFLSVGAIVGDTYLCVHAGVSGANFTRRSLRGIYKPYIFVSDDNIVKDMMWSNPAVGLYGSCMDGASGIRSLNYGLPLVVSALTSIGCKGMIRGHTILKNGHDTLWNIVFSIFSATDTNFKGNKGAVIEVGEKGGITVAVMDVKPLRSAWERKHRETIVFPKEEKKDEDVKKENKKAADEKKEPVAAK